MTFGPRWSGAPSGEASYYQSANPFDAYPHRNFMDMLNEVGSHLDQDSLPRRYYQRVQAEDREVVAGEQHGSSKSAVRPLRRNPQPCRAVAQSARASLVSRAHPARWEESLAMFMPLTFLAMWLAG